MDEQNKALIDGTGPLRPQSTLPTAIDTPALVEQLKAEQVSPEAAAQPYAQSADYMKQLNTNSSADIQRNHVDTIGTERGGQRSLLVGGNDHYMMSRYSTPAVEDLANSFKVAASTRAFNQSMSNELERMQKEYERAAKARRSRDAARAAAAAQASGGVAGTFGALKENVVDDPNPENRADFQTGQIASTNRNGKKTYDQIMDDKYRDYLYENSDGKWQWGNAYKESRSPEVRAKGEEIHRKLWNGEYEGIPSRKDWQIGEERVIQIGGDIGLFDGLVK